MLVAEVLATGAFWFPPSIFDMFSILNHLIPLCLLSTLVLQSLFAESCGLVTGHCSWASRGHCSSQLVITIKFIWWILGWEVTSLDRMQDGGPSPLVVIKVPVVPFVKGEIVNLGVLADFQSV